MAIACKVDWSILETATVGRWYIRFFKWPRKRKNRQ